MKEFNIVFGNDDGRLQTDRCQVEKVIKLSWGEFSLLCQNPYDDHACITDNASFMRIDEKGTYHCLLILNNANNDGIVIMDTENERAVSYIPFAKDYMERELYPTLAQFNKNMIEAVDEQVEKALRYQKQGQYSFPESELYDKEPFDMDVFISMLAERPEINMAGQDDDIVRIVVAPKFAYEEDDSHLRELTQKEFELIYAKHLLWLDNGSGEQADFSNCLLRSIEMSNRWLENAIFDGAKIVDSGMVNTNCNNASFKGARIIKSDCMDLTATGADFSEAKISNCIFIRADMAESNFTKTAFWDCDLYNTVLRECCLEKTKFHRTDIEDCDTTDCVYDEQEWMAEKNGISME